MYFKIRSELIEKAAHNCYGLSIVVKHCSKVLFIVGDVGVLAFSDTYCKAYTRAYRDEWTVLEKSGNVHNNSFASITDQNEAASVNIRRDNNKVNIGQSEQATQNHASSYDDWAIKAGYKIIGSNSNADNPRCLLLCSSVK
jgi:hypothetical protein